MTRYFKQARLLAGVVALIVGLTFAAPPAFAAGAPALAPRPLAAAAAAKVEAMPAAALAQAAQPAVPAAEPGAKPFFKTGKGLAAGVLIAAAVVMTFVSYGNDRVKSPAK